jgi:hypothetical protein
VANGAAKARNRAALYGYLESSEKSEAMLSLNRNDGFDASFLFVQTMLYAVHYLS